ncbi:hypothetical protein BO71DRAFT_459616 [Aspergillus ellipticus CBS 707.79]|uniref:Xylanolytic transcriptional activator regulatory domain-containing protein n=1 Tax=Aspergillus ellipticus CBS 707.79 TaxID=1448320 RepID=A0A319D2V2_9EURO|nr:hypothetical protein BO71DRAFT_459616 [Aspergillus ellipticus CBS 707.79]
MQYLGNMSQSWLLVSAATRVLVCLNYHTILDGKSLCQPNEDIRACIYWCYYLDKLLSLLLARPASLPRLKSQPASSVQCDISNPSTVMMHVLLLVAEVQELSLDIYLHEAATDEFTAIVYRDLDDKMQSLRGSIDQAILTSPAALHTSWIDFDYGYFAIQTHISQHRLRKLGSMHYHEQCLSSARKALTMLQYLQSTVSKEPSSPEPFPSFLVWTILLFPLSPYFVLFYNVVSTSNVRDFILMKDVTAGLSRFTAANPCIDKLHHFLESLLNLCSPLVEPALSDRMSTLPQTGGVAENSGRDDIVLWTDDLMWELFTSQPSLDRLGLA